MEEIPFQVDVTRTGHGLMVSISGDLDFANASRFDAALQEALTDKRVRLTLDFHRVKFLDSEGIKVLVRAYRRVAETRGEIAIVGCSQTAAKLFDVLGLTSVLGVQPPARDPRSR